MNEISAYEQQELLKEQLGLKKNQLFSEGVGTAEYPVYSSNGEDMKIDPKIALVDIGNVDQ